MNTINWKPNALKQVEKSRKLPRASGFLPKRKPWLISAIQQVAMLRLTSLPKNKRC
jgi:hypothetical protein